jgi:hypothetical protein
LFAVTVVGRWTQEEAHAGLLLHIDTATQEFFFSGSDSGTPVFFFSFYSVIWDVGTISDPTELLPHDGLSASGNTLLSSNVDLYETGALTNAAFPFSDPVTLTGNGKRKSYASANDAQRAYFEGTIGSRLTPSVGTGFSDIRVVPEPSPLVLIGIAGALVIVFNRRRIRHWAALGSEAHTESQTRARFIGFLGRP